MDPIQVAAHAGLHFDRNTLAWSALPDAPVLPERPSTRKRLLASLPWNVDRRRAVGRVVTPSGALYV